MKLSHPNLSALKQQALVHLQHSRNEQAGRLFAQIVAADARDAEAWYYLGIVYGRFDSLAEAENCLKQAVSCRPSFDQAHYWLGMMLVYQNRPVEAAESFAQAVRRNPRNIDAWNRLGKTHQEMGDLVEAVRCFRKAIGLSDGNSDSHNNMGKALYEQGLYDQALASYRKALSLDPSNLSAALGYHLSLPIVYRDLGHLQQARERYLAGLDQLAGNAERYKQRRSLVTDLLWNDRFYLAYQGLDDKPLQTRFARFFQGLAAATMPQMTAPLPRRPVQGRRIRVAYLSHYFRHHTVSYYFRSWIERADRDRFEISVYHLDPVGDDVAREIAGACDVYRPVTGSLSAIAATIRKDAPDILIYPEIGMHPRHAWLAALRLAPIQCAAWGHPVTTGFDTIDYYLSSDATEPDDAQEHYSETLVRLGGLGVYCKPSESPEGVTRAEFGLPEGRTLYLCSQSAFKIHVDTDDLLAAVAVRDPHALIVLFQDGRAPVDEALKSRLYTRFSALGLDPERQLLFMRRLAHADYLRFNRIADVMLDTPHWSGGRTSLDALACGLPIVTLPGAYSRGRQTCGMLRMMKMNELIATTPSEYADRAVAIARDRSYRMRLAQEIESRAPGCVFEDDSGIRSLEGFLVDAVK